MSKFLGLQYPLAKSSSGFLSQSSDVDQIKADVLQLLLTNPGERVCLPDFGTPLRKLMFEPNDSVLEAAAKNMIAESMNKWEPRIVVKDIIITSNFPESNLNMLDDGTESGAILGITIQFINPQDIQTVEELKLELPLNATQ
jgi:phage baseplate assembly protein W